MLCDNQSSAVVLQTFQPSLNIYALGVYGRAENGGGHVNRVCMYLCLLVLCLHPCVSIIGFCYASEYVCEAVLFTQTRAKIIDLR
jgi:hypothetical protein